MVRRVVTGHDEQGRSEVVSDADAAVFEYGPPGDIVVMNGTMHRWHNRGATTAKVASIVIGAEHDAFPESTSA